MPLKELISIIIPVYNGEEYITEALESVFNQTYKNLEIIVVDDGSTDQTSTIVKSFPNISYHFQQNQGTACARNQGIALAKGPYFAFLDADDTWLPDKLENQMMAFSTNSHLDMVTGYVEQFYSPKLNLENLIQLPNSILEGCIPSAILIKRQAFFKTGLFDPQLKLTEFFDWYLRFREVGLKEYTLSKVVTRRRIHKKNKGFIQKDNKAYLLALKASLDRRRNKINP